MSKFPSIEPQEIFLDRLSRKKEEELGISEKKFEVPLSKKILKGALLFFIILLLFLLVKTFQFQVLDYKKFSALAEENKFIIHSINAERGVIYDSRGEQLIFNKPSFNLVLDKSKLPEDDSEKIRIFKEVSGIIGKDIIYNDLENEVLVSKNLDHQTLILLKTKIDRLPGFQVEQNSIRYYIEGPSFAHLLGYIGKGWSDYVGRDGLEKSYEEILRKNPGKIRVETDAYGNLLSKEIISLPESGKSLVLWLDAELQRKIEQSLEKILEKTGAQKAAGVALNPKTGGVMALVSIPTYDNNLFNKEADQESLKNLLIDPQEPLFNRAISGLYATGSTVKPFIATAALEEEIISPLKKIDCQGKIVIPNKYNPEIATEKQDWRIHGLTDIRKAIAESCNVYFYTIGGGYKDQIGLGPTRIKKYLELFGWGKKTGIDLPGEVQGFIPYPEWKKENKKEDWWDGDTYNLSIGQGDIKVTPLQVAAAFVAVANNGTLLKPKVVKEIVDSKKNLIDELEPEILRENFVNPENLQIIREGMRNAVTGEGSPYASSVLLNSLPISSAAKTGTAQTQTLKAGYFHNWITVFAPYEDPQIVLTIMIENIKEVQAVALPVAKEVLEWYFSR